MSGHRAHAIEVAGQGLAQGGHDVVAVVGRGRRLGHG
jgi:hypothetical protein